MLSCGGCVTLFLHTTYLIVYRLEWSELVLFFFCETNIRNSWTSTLAAAPRTVRELVLFKRSFTSNLYGNFPWKNNLQLKATDLETEARISKFCQYSAMKSTVSLFFGGSVSQCNNAVYWQEFQRLDSYSNTTIFKKSLAKSCSSWLHAFFDTIWVRLVSEN